MKEIICIIGPSGAGKTTLAQGLVDKVGGHIIVSHTTRPSRPGEKDGEDYYFVDQDTYNNLDLIEAVEYNDYSYGLSVNEVESKKEPDRGYAVAVVTFEGYQHILDKYPASPIYLDVDLSNQIDRLIHREDPIEKIRERIRLRDHDSQSKKKVLDDGGIVLDANQDPESLVLELVRILQAKEKTDLY